MEKKNADDFLSELNKELGVGEELTEEDLIELENVPKKETPFPIFTLIFAILKDLIDFLTFGFIGTITNIVAWIVIRLYLFKKINFIKRFLYKRFILTYILEYVPFINIFPFWTFFVLRAYATEKGKINQVLNTIEKIIMKISTSKS